MADRRDQMLELLELRDPRYRLHVLGHVTVFFFDDTDRYCLGVDEPAETLRRQ